MRQTVCSTSSRLASLLFSSRSETVSCATGFPLDDWDAAVEEEGYYWSSRDRSMAKARKPPQGAFPAAEMFLGFHHHRGGSVAPAYDDGGDDDLPDLGEADVWYSPSSEGSADRRGGGGGGLEIGRGGGGGTTRKVGGLSRVFAHGRQVAASAPVEVPAWPGRCADPDPAAYAEKRREADANADDAGDGDGWVPPHVYLARRQARSSMVEGVGRTLKGRDASRVRDAVWSRTGFDG